MKKTTIILWALLTTTVLLAGCGDKTDKTDATNKQATTTQAKAIKTSSKEPLLLTRAKNVGIKNPNIEKFKKAYQVWVKCMDGYCKTEYENLKKDKLALEYFQKLVTKDKIPPQATKFDNAKEKAEAIAAKGYNSMWECFSSYSAKYDSIWECIKDNYKKWKINPQTKKQIEEYLTKVDWKYNITFPEFIEVQRTCEWWWNHWWKDMKELNKELEEMRKQGFQAPNFIKSNYEAYFKNKMVPQDYFKMLNDICEVAKHKAEMKR